MRFTFTETARYRSPGPVFYESNELPIGLDYQRIFSRALVQSRVNGANTAYATLFIIIKWASDASSHWSISLNRHFFGRAAAHKARAWCNFLLNNPPSSWQKIEEPKMSKYRTKPIIVEAEQWWPQKKIVGIEDANEKACGHSIERGPHVHTLEGPLQVSPGDWIIKGIRGEFYPCKPDIFAATYEETKDA